MMSSNLLHTFLEVKRSMMIMEKLFPDGINCVFSRNVYLLSDVKSPFDYLYVMDSCCKDEQLSLDVNKLFDVGIHAVSYFNKGDERYWVYLVDKDVFNGRSEKETYWNEVVRFFGYRSFLYENFLKNKNGIYINYIFRSNSLIVGYFKNFIVDLNFYSLKLKRDFVRLLSKNEYLVMSLLSLYYFDKLDSLRKEQGVNINDFKYVKVDMDFIKVIKRYLSRADVNNLDSKKLEELIMFFGNIVLGFLKD